MADFDREDFSSIETREATSSTEKSKFSMQSGNDMQQKESTSGLSRLTSHTLGLLHETLQPRRHEYGASWFIPRPDSTFRHSPNFNPHTLQSDRHPFHPFDPSLPSTSYAANLAHFDYGFASTSQYDDPAFQGNKCQGQTLFSEEQLKTFERMYNEEIKPNDTPRENLATQFNQREPPIKIIFKHHGAKNHQRFRQQFRHCADGAQNKRERKEPNRIRKQRHQQRLLQQQQQQQLLQQLRQQRLLQQQQQLVQQQQRLLQQQQEQQQLLQDQLKEQEYVSIELLKYVEQIQARPLPSSSNEQPVARHFLNPSNDTEPNSNPAPSPREYRFRVDRQYGQEEFTVRWNGPPASRADIEQEFYDQLYLMDHSRHGCGE